MSGFHLASVREAGTRAYVENVKARNAERNAKIFHMWKQGVAREDIQSAYGLSKQRVNTIICEAKRKDKANGR